MKHTVIVPNAGAGVKALRGLRTRYIFVLGLAGMLSLISYLLLGITLEQQDTRAAEINMAGRQRMLSQRIGLLQARFREARSPAEARNNLLKMNDAVDLMEKSHIGLIEGNSQTGVSAPSSEALKAMYFGPEMFVDKEVKEFVQVARQYMLAAGSGAGVTGASLHIDATTSIKLLSHLDRIVGQYQKENEEKVSQIQVLRHLTVIVTLAVLLLSGLLVFRPMVSRVYRNVAELEEAEVRFRSIAESSRMAMVIGEGADARIAEWNPAAEKIFGYSHAEILGQRISTLIPERFRAAHVAGYDKAREFGELTGGGEIHQLTALHKDGHEFPVELSIGSWEKSGERYFCGFITDITDRLKSRRVTDRLGRIVENATNEFFLFDAETLKFVFVNRGGLNNLGYTHHEILKLGPQDVIDDYDQARFDAAVEPLRSGRKDIVLHAEKMIRADGTTYNSDVVLQLMKNESPPMFLAVVNDVSDKVELEQSLRRSQKLEAVGQLAGGIAHDFNNLLGIILGNLQMLARKAKLDERSARRVETSLKATNRAADLTKQILGFSRLSPTNHETLNVNDVIAGMHKLIEQSAGPNVTVDLKLQQDLWSADLDQGDLEDAIVNMCVNAGHAMPDGGKLKLETWNVQSGADIDPELTTKGKNLVALSISDNGQGITREIREKIFEPFFTTKIKGQGTGLGLAMVFGFVTRSKGDIRVYSEPGLGTTFTLYLPRSDSDADAEADETPVIEDISLVGGTEKILVVDDEAELAEVAAEYLMAVGYEVLTAASGKQALLMLEQHPDIALVFSDVVMPGTVNGFQLAVKIFRTRPDIRVILTSGFAWEGDKTMQGSVQFVKHCIKGIIRKPYEERGFLQKIRQTLDEQDSIEFSSEYESGLSFLDEDHRLICSLLNLASRSLDRNESKENIQAIIEDLTSSTTFHFHQEEVILDVVEHPRKDSQILMHKMLLSGMAKLVSRYEMSNDIQDAREVINFLEKWLMTHIEESKQGYPSIVGGNDEEIRRALDVQGPQPSSVGRS